MGNSVTVVHEQDGAVVYAVGDGFVVSQDRVWVDGVYETIAAAVLGANANVSALSKLWALRRPTPLSVRQVEELGGDYASRR